MTETTPFKSGYISLVGWPNVGKSTLLNKLIGAKLAIVSPKAQTTRDATLGILNATNMQAIFVDTPGWLSPKDSFQSFMKRAILRSVFDDADVIAWLVDPRPLTANEADFGTQLLKANKPILTLINKVDKGEPRQGWAAVEASIKAVLGDKAKIIRISAQTGDGLDRFRSMMANHLPEGQPYFPTDQLTDRWERFYVAELIREQIFELYQEEVPHAAAVMVEEFVESPGKKDHIKVIIYVETPGQLAIIVGQRGNGIKNLGQRARAEVEARLERPIHLEMAVKVRKNWRKDGAFLDRLQSNSAEVY